MVVHHTQSERFAAQREPVRTWHESLPTATLAPKVAQRERAVTRRAYRFKGSWSPHTIELYKRFLAAIAEECPEAVTEWQALLPLGRESVLTRPGEYYTPEGAYKWRRGKTGPEADAANDAYKSALVDWANTYHLNTRWLLQAVDAHLAQVVNVGGPLTWPTGFSTDLYYSPLVKGFTVEIPDSEPGELIEAYRRRVDELFKAAHARIDSAIESLESDPRLEREAYMQANSWRPVHEAAHWQTRGARTGLSGRKLRADSETVRKVLRRLQLTPRPGL